MNISCRTENTKVRKSMGLNRSRRDEEEVVSTHRRTKQKKGLMTWIKCYAQYVIKLGKLRSGHRTRKITFHSNLKEGQCQRLFKLPYNCTHFTC